MKIDFSNQLDINLNDVDYGDVLILGDGSKWLVIKDTDGYDYRGINLETYEISVYATTIKNLVCDEICGTVVQIIKSEDLILRVR